MNTIQIGNILVSTWGYDQTNVEFYQVTGCTKTMLTLRKIKALEKYKSDNWIDGGLSYALADEFISKEFKRKIKKNYNNEIYVDITSYASAKLMLDPKKGIQFTKGA